MLHERDINEKVVDFGHQREEMYLYVLQHFEGVLEI